MVQFVSTECAQGTDTLCALDTIETVRSGAGPWNLNATRPIHTSLGEVVYAGTKWDSLAPSSGPHPA
jgi:hypothetical protein